MVTNEYSNSELGLIYVHKIGKNIKYQGLYEFIFSHDISNIDVELWNWDRSPACDNATPPTADYIDKIVSLKTDTFDLFCLHQAVDREYMHGYHTIHALAYETGKEDSDGYVQYENLINDDDDLPLLVFHYGMTLDQIIGIFKNRKFVLRGEEFVEVSQIVF